MGPLAKDLEHWVVQCILSLRLSFPRSIKIHYDAILLNTHAAGVAQKGMP